jgi:phospholipase/lecithinase/hemolysin
MTAVKSTRTIPQIVTTPVGVACLALTLFAAQNLSAQSAYSGVVVFGTSLSDPGNAFALSGEAGTPSDFMVDPLLIPAAPYAIGGHHFSNGATWVEQLGRASGLGGSVSAAFASHSQSATNFAVGGARAYDDGINFNLTRQVDEYLRQSGGVAPSDALFAIEMGSNDVRDAFQAYATGGNGGPILQAALTSIAANIQRLYQAGARNFLVWVLPNVALTPAIRALGPAAQALATDVTQGFNLPLGQTIGQLEAVLPGVRFSRLDAYQLLTAIVADPDAFGLATATRACLTPEVAPYSCTDPDAFLFWDGIHPTRAGHAILAQEAARVLR